MGAVDDILRRMADDPSFASLVEQRPTEALNGIALSPDEIRRLEHAIREIHGDGAANSKRSETTESIATNPFLTPHSAEPLLPPGTLR